jgi:hypothetical protein
VPHYWAANVLDGNPNTIWHTPWEGKVPGFPHEIAVALPDPLLLKGISCLPRQDMPTGRIKNYIVQVSDDGRSWREAARGVFDNSANVKQVLFNAPITTRYLKLIAVSGFGDKPYIALAELSVIPVASARPKIK